MINKNTDTKIKSSAHGADRVTTFKIERLESQIQWNLSNPTYQGTREMCRIVHDVRTCLIRHTKGPEKCVGVYRMSEPV